MTVKTTLFAVVALSVAAIATSARAGDWGHGWEGRQGGWDRWSHVDDFCKKNGVKFSDGFFYPGKVQKHFTETWYDWHYKIYLSFDPHAHMPYYFCEGHGVWYPVSYIEKVGPGAKGPGPVIAKGGPAPVGGAPAVGAPAGGAPAAGGAPVVAPAGGAPAVAPAGNGPAPVEGVPAGGANVAPAGGAAPAAGPAPAGAAAPANPVSVPTAVVAKNETSVQKLPDSVFDGAVPEDVK